MVVDPNDILIFKLRGREYAPQAEGGGIGVQVEMLEQPLARAEAAGAQAKTAAPRGLGEAELAEYYKKQQSEEAALKLEIEEESKKSSKLSKGEEESKESAKGFACINHPWRPAYAVCNYCKRPFCYADLVEYDSKFFCLEDIDRAAGRQNLEVAVIRPNIFSKSSGVFFLLNALALAYFELAQFSYLFEKMSAVGISAFLLNINYSYGISLLNLVVVGLGLAAAAFSFKPNKQSLYVTSILGGIILVVTSYEYLSSNFTYMLIVTILAFFSVGALAYGRMNQTPVEKMTEIHNEAIDWPRLETF